MRKYPNPDGEAIILNSEKSQSAENVSTRPGYRQPVQIKGVRDSLLIIVAESDWSEMFKHLISELTKKQNFLSGARVAIDVGKTDIRSSELGLLRDKMSDMNISLAAVISGSEITQKSSQLLGIGTRLMPAKADEKIKAIDPTPAGETASFIRRTLRSGTRVVSESHVVVIGDVNPGAEIIASGSIVVWGKLRGVVHAGAKGDETAVVCALDMEPNQLRIAEHAARFTPKKGKHQPEMASIQDNGIIAQLWVIK